MTLDVAAEPIPAVEPMPYGGYRLHPDHFEPARVPTEISQHAGRISALHVGSPGKVGLLELEFRLNGTRTELSGHYQKSPLQIMRPLYFDPLRPDMPYTFLMSTGGGIVQGDRLRTDLTFGPGTSAYLTTQAHTRVYKMETNYAAASTYLSLGEDSLVEYVPDPVIPFAQSRFYQRTVATVDHSASLIAGETIYAGRLARDERHQYDVYASDFEVRRPDGSLVAVDKVRLTPANHGVDGPAVMGGHDILAMLYVITARVPAQELADEIHAALALAFAGDEMRFGVSVLPYEAGMWLRILCNDPTTMAKANTLAWSVAHQRLSNTAAPLIRKS